MAGHRKFSELRAQMSPEQRARAEERTARMLAEMPLHELRRARRLSQEALAAALGARQSSISKLERRADMYVSTLRSYVEALGGELEIRARFPDGEVRIAQFSQIGEEDEPDAVPRAPSARRSPRRAME